MGDRRCRFALAGLMCLWAAVAGATHLAGARESPDTDPPRRFSRANKEKIQAYVALLRLRHDLFLKWKETGKWPDDKDANAALAAHGAYWEQRLQEGSAVLAGGMKGDYWDNVALIVFEAGSEAEAERIVRDDPAVRTYVFQAQVRPFDIHFITNKYRTE